MAALTIISGNLTVSISDHHPQLLVAPNTYFNSSYPKSDKYEKTGQNLIRKNLPMIIFKLTGII